MALRILIGWHKEHGVEGLYVGEDGAECQSIAEDAAKTEDYTRIGCVVSPSLIPFPTDPTPTKASGRPPARERKPSEALGKVSQASPTKHIADREGAERARRARFGLKPLDEVKPGDAIDGGPTLEEYIKHGYKAENYPPQGYKPRSSPAYDALLAKQQEAKAEQDRIVEENKKQTAAAIELAKASGQPKQDEPAQPKKEEKKNEAA